MKKHQTIELVQENILEDNINLSHLSETDQERLINLYRTRFYLHPVYTRTLTLPQAIEVDKMIERLDPRTCTYSQLHEVNSAAGATVIPIGLN